ncbi:hypothetical protein CIT26_06215 [Mesorhizobium temperatum]|uniref:Uncharacterized protein n=1 Tax=Mesorhizobium temperatum TaxID=241416 RepID=A0A271LRV0_9HYPH|nr:hypothetical protein [Mesorhizobium temperatum]PAQ10902.1 hypothetical protein CIT26_06215 [Mesorhizobium temperatum]
MLKEERLFARRLTCLPTPRSKDRNQPPAEGKDIFDRAGECDPAGKAQPGRLFLESGAALAIAQDGELRLCLGGKCRELVDYVIERSRIKMAKADRASTAIGVRLAARIAGQIDPIRNRLSIGQI